MRIGSVHTHTHMRMHIVQVCRMSVESVLLMCPVVKVFMLMAGGWLIADSSDGTYID